MATTKKTTASKAAPKAAAVAAHGHAELEAKVVGLEKLVAELKKELKEHCAKSEKEHAELAAKCDLCCAAKSGSDPELEARVNKIWRWVSQDRLFKGF